MSGRRKNQSTADFLKALIIREVINSMTKEFRQDIRNGIKYARKRAGKKAKDVARRYREGGIRGVVRGKQQDTPKLDGKRVDVENQNDSPYPTRFRDSESGDNERGHKDLCREHDERAQHSHVPDSKGKEGN